MAHFAIKEKLKESAVIKKDGKKQMTTGVRDLCVKIGNLADHGWFCCTVEEHGICFVCFVCFDSLCPINNLSVKQGRVFLG